MLIYAEHKSLPGYKFDYIMENKGKKSEVLSFGSLFC